MAKVLNNIPSIEQFIVEKSDTTNLGYGKMEKWANGKMISVVQSGATCRSLYWEQGKLEKSLP